MNTTSTLSIEDQNTINRLCDHYNGFHYPPLQHTITLVSYADETALPYFLYSAMLLEVFADFHGYGLQLFCASHAPEGYPREEDARWQKVQVLREISHHFYSSGSGRGSGSGNETRYLVWVDADLIFVHFNHSLDIFTMEPYSHYEMIISAEVHGGTGVANTGCFLLQLYPQQQSSQSLLLEEWWAFDHKIGHDQILFNTFYQSHWQEIKSRVAIVPTLWLNSHPPVYQTWQAGQAVLHLMGESVESRCVVFHHAVHHLCHLIQSYNNFTDSDHYSTMEVVNNLHLLQQNEEEVVPLGIDQQFLHKTFYSVSHHRLLNIITKLRRDNKFEEDDDWQSWLSLWQESRELLLTLQKLAMPLYELETWHKRLYCRWLTFLLSHWMTEMISHVHSIRLCDIQQRENEIEKIQQPKNMSSILSSDRLIEAIHMLAILGNDWLTDLFHLMEGDEKVTEGNLQGLIDDLRSYLQTLLHLTHPQSHRLINEHQAMLWQSQARLSIYHNRSDEALYALEKALDSLGQTGNAFHRLPVLIALGDLLCHTSPADSFSQEIGGNISLGMFYYHQSIEMLEGLLRMEEQYKAEHDLLVGALEGAIQCHYDSSSSSMEMIEIYKHRVHTLREWKNRSHNANLPIRQEEKQIKGNTAPSRNTQENDNHPLSATMITNRTPSSFRGQQSSMTKKFRKKRSVG